MSKEVRNSICPECGSYRVTYEHTDDYDWQLCTCERCGCSGTPDEFFHNSVFARITSSPEALAPYLVSDDEWGFHSSITDVGEREDIGAYDTEEEAIAATVARLKEAAVVENG